MILLVNFVFRQKRVDRFLETNLVTLATEMRWLPLTTKATARESLVV